MQLQDMAEYQISLAREIGSRLDIKSDKLIDAVITGDIGESKCCNALILSLYFPACGCGVLDWSVLSLCP